MKFTTQLILVLFMSLGIFGSSSVNGQSLCSGSANDEVFFSYQHYTHFSGYPNPTFNSQTTGSCTPTGYLTSVGHKNTGYFSNGICLLDFWNPGAYGGTGIDPNSTTFFPGHSGNILVFQTIPQGTIGSITEFTVQAMQLIDQSPNFQYQGVGVYRDGTLIYESKIPMVLGTMTFSFPDEPEFKSDGSEAVEFKISFGLVKRIEQEKTGYGLITLKGRCGTTAADPPVISSVTGTCTGTTPNSDGVIKLPGSFNAAWHYDIATGSSYSGSITYAAASSIPGNGVLSSTLAPPNTSQDYTVRFISSDGCYVDVTTTLYASNCPCMISSDNSATATLATCTGASANNDASIQITSVDGEKYGYSTGATYSGASYAAATAFTTSASITGLSNPTGGQTYTVRIYGDASDCYEDVQVSLVETTCGTCKKITAMIVEMDDIDVKTSNDIVSTSICETNDIVDIEITKTVTPSSGVAGVTDFTFTLTVTNDSTLTAHNLVIKDVFPEDSLVVQSVASSLGTVTAGGYWVIDSLPGNTSATATLVFKASKVGSLRNCAALASITETSDPDSDPNNAFGEDDDDCVSITVTGKNTPDVDKMFHPGITRPNELIQLELTFVNNESTAITLSADFIDSLPTNMEVASPANLATTLGGGIIAIPGTGTITLPQNFILPPGVSTVTLDVIATADGVYCNNIAIGDLQTSAGSNLKPAETCVNAFQANALMPKATKSFSPSVITTGSTSILTIEILNENATSITTMLPFTDYLPAGMTVAAGSQSTTCGTLVAAIGANTVVLNAGAVIPPGTCTITVPVTAATATTLCNYINANSVMGSLPSGQMVANMSVDKACLTILSSGINDLALITTLSEGQNRFVSPGDTVDFDITVYNQGTNDATNVKITDYLPTDMTYGVNPTWSATGVSSKFEHTFPGTIKATERATVQIKLVMKPSFVGTVITNYAEIKEANFGGGIVYTDVDCSYDNNNNNDPGGAPNTPADNQIFGDGSGSIGGSSAMGDEDDHDPAQIEKLILGSLGDYIWLDRDKDGLQEVSEPAVPNIKVCLINANDGEIIDSTTTDASGLYLFTSLVPDNYRVKFVKPDNSDFTVQSQSNTTDGSDVSIITGKTTTYSLGNGEHHRDLDAGLLLYASVGDYVWYDDINNGHQDASENPVSAVVVKLYNDNDVLIDSTSTDVNGLYLFDKLEPATYYVEFSELPANYKFAYHNGAGNDSTDSDADPATGKTADFTIDWNQHPRTWDAGIVHNSITPVPVDLLTLSGHWEAQNATIEWSTASEVNSSHFEIWRSIDNGQFILIDQVYSQAINGASNSILDYQFLDFNVKSVVAKNVFYRLVQVDFDGTSEDHGIVTLTTSNSNTSKDLTVYPNPTANSVTFIANGFTKDVNVTITDVTGKIINQSSYSGKGFYRSKFDFSSYRQGLYFITVADNQNSVSKRISYIK